MATPPPSPPPPPPPQPRASQPGYGGANFTPPSTSTPRPEKRATPPPFSSPVAARGIPAQQEDGGGSASGSPVPQFSTPPGPPVFGSSLRPAAVPFTPSPAPPPPPPFFSPSSLPTSSPPHFSKNGLHGSLSHHPTAAVAVDDLNPDAAAPYILFSAHKVLKSKKLANTPSLGFGALVSPGREIGPGPQIVQRDPRRCHNCGAYVNLYCNISIDSGKWLCAICKNSNESEGEYVVARREDLMSWPELSSPVVDYVQMGSARPGFIPVPDSRVSAPVFLVIDECLDEVHLQHLQSSLHAFVDCLPTTTRLGIISYGRTVSVYDFSEDAIASADVLPGDKSPTEESLKALIYGTGIYLAPIHASLQAAHCIISSMRPCKMKTAEVMRDRCIGTAVEVALAIIQGPTAETLRGLVKRSGDNCRILVCSGGPNTYGPGSVPHSLSHPNYPYMEKTAIKWMENLGNEAQRHNIVIDILCAGTCPVRVPVLQPLAKASGGVLVLHDDFGEAFGVNLQRATKRAAGSHGLFEIRCSDGILVSRVIGPGEEAIGEAHESLKNDHSTCIHMLSVEETQSFTLFMETTSDIKNNNVFFQFVVRYSNIYQSDILRIFTVRLPTVDSVAAYLGSIQEEVAAVLVAKKTVLLAKTASDAIDMRLTIDERVKDIAMKYGSQIPKTNLYRFPKELPLFPEHLFHLKRGPLLGNIVGHEDERSVLRNLFLHASFDLALRMVAPRCMMHREEGTFEELPAYDLAMQSDAAVVLDHGTDVFIWLGNELAAQEGRSAAALAACRTLAEELTDNRFPAPRILAFKEGSSQARYFVSRLIPAHKDPPYEQEARFPQLRTLMVEQRARLKSSFLHFDDLSFCEWMRSLKLVPPEPS